MDNQDEVPYLEVKMPERFLLQFRLDDGSWMDEAVCLRRLFQRLDNGSYICSEFSSGLWIRCIADHGDHFERARSPSQRSPTKTLSSRSPSGCARPKP